MWSNVVRELDVDKPALTVDEDKDGALLKAAVEQHKTNRSAADIFAALPFRDSADAASGCRSIATGLPSLLKEIRETMIPTYLLDGWNDRYVRDEAILFNNLDNPKRLTIGPGPTPRATHLDFGAEHLRWWDYWLRESTRGSERNPVHYF